MRMDRVSKQVNTDDEPPVTVARKVRAPRKTSKRATSRVTPAATKASGARPPATTTAVEGTPAIPDELVPFLATNEAEGRMQYQRSLDLFDEGTSIIESRNDLLLKKGSQRIRSETSLNLLQKKLFNALLFVARPTLSGGGMFSVPVDYLSWCVSHDRSDMKYLKDSVRAMKKAVIEVENGEKWFMTSLLADALFDGKNLVYDIPPLIRNLFSAPKRYYYISMVVNARFRSKYALALYEMLKEFEYRGETDMMSIEEFRERMGVERHEYPEFKRLSARTIAGPLQELEELSDFTAEVKYDYRGRKIVGIKFIIKPNPKNQYTTDQSERIRPEYWTMMKDEFGLNRSQLDELTSAYPTDRVEEVCDVLYYRYIVKDKAIKNGYRLLSTALQDTDDKYHLTNREKNELVMLKEQHQKKSFEQEMQDAQRKAHAARLSEFNATWANWSDDEQLDHWHAFLASAECAPLLATRLIKPNMAPDIANAGVRAAFMNYLLRMGKLGD